MISETLPNGIIRTKRGKSRDGFRSTLNLMYVTSEGNLRAGHTEIMAQRLKFVHGHYETSWSVNGRYTCNILQVFHAYFKLCFAFLKITLKFLLITLQSCNVTRSENRS
jgi:hypothetical protein